MNSDALHTYEVHLVFPSTMTIDQVIDGIEEMLPYADYQVVELGEGDPNE